MAQRALFIVNRLSRFGGIDLTPAIERLRRNGFELRVEMTRTPADIGYRIRNHAQQIDLVVVAGGDGSANAAADALIETGLPFGLLPVGTANDLARTLGIPMELVAASDVVAHGAPRAIDVGRINGKHFFNVASLGLSTLVASRMTPQRKVRWGALAYPGTVIEAWRGHHPFDAEIVCDGRAQRVRSIQVVVGNGRHYGGGFTVAEDAAIDDARLHVYSIPPVPLWRLAALAHDMRKGRHGQREEVLLEACREVEIRTRGRRMPVNTDGEITTRTPARIHVLPQALTVMAPPAAESPPHAAG